MPCRLNNDMAHQTPSRAEKPIANPATRQRPGQPSPMTLAARQRRTTCRPGWSNRGHDEGRTGDLYHEGHKWLPESLVFLTGTMPRPTGSRPRRATRRQDGTQQSQAQSADSLNYPNSRYSLARRSRYPGEAGWYLGADRRRLVAGQGAEVCDQVAGGRFSVPGDWVGTRGHDAGGGLEAHLRDSAGVVPGSGEEEFAAYVGEREGGLYGPVGARSTSRCRRQRSAARTLTAPRSGVLVRSRAH